MTVHACYTNKQILSSSVRNILIGKNEIFMPHSKGKLPLTVRANIFPGHINCKRYLRLCLRIGKGVFSVNTCSIKQTFLTSSVINDYSGQYISIKY